VYALRQAHPADHGSCGRQGASLARQPPPCQDR
jgi:hypothetical protein